MGSNRGYIGVLDFGGGHANRAPGGDALSDFQVFSGVLLLAGAAIYAANTGSVAFAAMTLGDTATWLIFIAFGIKAAFPLLNGWLQDAYPEATVTGNRRPIRIYY